MSLFSSAKFASAAASGTDWRDTSKHVLEELQEAKTNGKKFNVGFLYITDSLVDDAESILNLFRSVLDIEHWVGCVGVGVCGTDAEFADMPAISAMIGSFDDQDFCLFPGAETEIADALKPWLQKNDPMLVWVHGNPQAETDPAANLKTLRDMSDGFLVGGLSSSRKTHKEFVNDVTSQDLSGVVFSTNVKVATALSQGCLPVGPIHTITRGSDHFINELNDQKALDVFEDDLRAMAMKKIDQNPDEIVLKTDEITGKEIIPDEYQHLFEGEMHIAFPISESDQQDYLVRNIAGIEPETDAMIVTQQISTGDRVMFVHRNHETVQSDLSSMLVGLRERVQRDEGDFKVKAALYVSCVARLSSQEEFSEIQLIQDIIGDVPLAGFYAGGEIMNGRLYGYTGILTLFL